MIEVSNSGEPEVAQDNHRGVVKGFVGQSKTREKISFDGSGNAEGPKNNYL